MRRMIGLGTFVSCALLLSACSEQTKKATDTTKDAVAKAAQGGLDNVGKMGDSFSKVVEDSKTKITDVASKASDALGDSFSKATEQVSKSLESVKGGPELLQKLTGVLPMLQKTLAGITDKESAESALPKLKEMEGTVSKLAGQFEGLPDTAKKSIGELIGKGAGSLQPLVERVLALPGIQEIRPKLEAIMKQLKGFQG